jgi:hypothetical protein
VLVGAAGLTALAGAYVTGISTGLLPEAGAGWGWELVTLVQGLLLALHAARRLEPGPGYLALLVLAAFAVTAAPGEATLLGWPLALALVALALLGLRRA